MKIKTVLKIAFAVAIIAAVVILIRYGYDAFMDDFNENLIDAKS